MKFRDLSSRSFLLRKVPHSPARTRALLWGCALLSGIQVGQAADPTVTYTKIADVSTTAPGVGSNFTSLSSISIDGGNVVFLGVSNGNATPGIYTATAGGLSLAEVADTTTVGTDSGNSLGSPFSNVLTPSISGTSIAFRGITNSFTGIYTGSIGTIGASLVAQQNDPAVELHEKISNVVAPAISGSHVAFFGNYINDGTGGVSGSGLYVGTAGVHATPTLVTDRLTSAPGHSNFVSFNSDLSADGNLVTFRGNYNGGGNGIYTSKADGTSQTLVADNNTPLPDHSGTFSLGLASPVVSGTNVAFSTGNGIYLSDATGIHTIADSTTFVPGQSGIQFSGGGFSSTVSLDGENVAFTAAYSGGSGIFLEKNGSLLPIVTTNSTLFGDPVYFYSMTNEALDGDNLAFSYLVNGSSGTTGVAVANVGADTSVPEPSAAIFLLGGIGSFALGRRSRKRSLANC